MWKGPTVCQIWTLMCRRVALSKSPPFWAASCHKLLEPLKLLGLNSASVGIISGTASGPLGPPHLHNHRPHLQMGKRRLRDVKLLSQGHKAG